MRPTPALCRIAILLFGIAVAPLHAAAAPGDLDPSFGESGLRRFGFGHGIDAPHGMLVQLDGKILLVGSAQVGDHDEIALARYEANGAPDTSFGGGAGRTTAWVTPSPNATAIASDRGYAVALQSSGKIIVAGQSSFAGGAPVSSMLVVRFNTNGTIDPTFGIGGFLNVPFAEEGALANAVAIQPDDHIVIAGTAVTGGNAHAALARLVPDGGIDETFNVPIGEIEYGFEGVSDGLNAVAVQPDGAILVGGWTNVAAGNHELAVARFSGAGVHDTSFNGGTGNLYWNPTSHEDEATCFGFQTGTTTPTKILVGAMYSGGDANTQMAVLRRNLDGTPDPTFDGDGIAFVPGRSYLGARRLAVQSSVGNPSRVWVAGDFYDGAVSSFGVAKMLLTGALDTAFDGDGIASAAIGTWAGAVGMVVSGGAPLLGGVGRNGANDDDFAVARFTSAGPRDTTFDHDGLRVDNVGDAPAHGTRMIRDAYGHYVIVGSVRVGGHYRTAIARLDSSGQLDPGFGVGGLVATQFASGDDSLSAVAQDAQGRYVAVGAVRSNAGEQVLIVRYLANGQLDPTLNGDGFWILAVGTVSSRACAVALRSDGRIVLAGTATDGTGVHPLLIRAFPDASLDASFGPGTGIVISSDGIVNVTDMALQPDNHVVIAGPDKFGLGTLTFMRFDTGGSAEGAFGSAGVEETSIDFEPNPCRAIALRPDGRILAAGAGSGGSDFGVLQLTAQGIPDSTFDGDGRARWSFLPGEDQAYAALILPDGRALLAGEDHEGSAAADFSLLRISSTGVLNLAPGAGGWSHVDFRGGSQDIARGVAVDPFGRTILAGEAGGLFAAARFVGDQSLVGVPALPRPFAGAGLLLASVGANPFRGEAEFAFALPAAGAITLDVFDVAGAHVRTLASGATGAGAHRVRWDGSDDTGHAAPAGVYFVRLAQGRSSLTVKATRVR